MSQPESRLSRKIMEALRAEGHFVFKVHGTEFVMAGLPDLIVCAQGHYIGLEVKMPSKRSNTSAIQVFKHEQIRAAGGTAAVICSASEALRVVNDVIGGQSNEK